MKKTQLKIFPCFKQCLLLLMTISVGASWALPAMKSSTVRTVSMTSSNDQTVSTNYQKLPKCPSGLDLYSPHNLKQSAIKLIVTGLNTWPSEGLQLLLTGYSKQDRHIISSIKPKSGNSCEIV